VVAVVKTLVHMNFSPAFYPAPLSYHGYESQPSRAETNKGSATSSVNFANQISPQQTTLQHPPTLRQSPRRQLALSTIRITLIISPTTSLRVARMVEQQGSTAELNVAEFHELTFPYTPSLIGPDFTLDENLAMPTLLKRQMNTVPKTNLGSLDMLPVELIQPILAQLDLRTLEDFRRVNQRALQLVSSVPEYKAIETYALGALRGILSTGRGRWTTCETLYKKLCTAACEYCGAFGWLPIHPHLQMSVLQMF
jgi:hypothetical protein